MGCALLRVAVREVAAAWRRVLRIEIRRPLVEEEAVAIIEIFARYVVRAFANQAQIEAWVAAAAAALGGVDVLVNNASGFGMADTEEGWQKSLDVDVMATVRASRAALPFLRAAKGCIVNTTSISGLGPSVRTPAYAAVKALVINYTASQAAGLAKDGIRVNAIAPGSIEFPGGMWEERKTTDPKLYGRILASIPFGRYGTPEEVANAALFLASPLAGWITGQTIVVDGGQTLS